LFNAGDQDRIHLVIDVEVTPDLLQIFPARFREQCAHLPEVRQRCARWLDATVGNIQRIQKRWHLKRRRVQQKWRQWSCRHEHSRGGTLQQDASTLCRDSTTKSESDCIRKPVLR
jgi:hypothetical protein